MKTSRRGRWVAPVDGKHFANGKPCVDTRIFRRREVSTWRVDADAEVASAKRGFDDLAAYLRPRVVMREPARY